MASSASSEGGEPPSPSETVGAVITTTSHPSGAASTIPRAWLAGSLQTGAMAFRSSTSRRLVDSRDDVGDKYLVVRYSSFNSPWVVSGDGSPKETLRAC